MTILSFLHSILQDVPAPGNEILFGIAPCLLALKRAKRVIHQAFITPSFQESNRNEAKSILTAVENQVEVKVVHRNELDRLSGQRPHQVRNGSFRDDTVQEIS